MKIYYYQVKELVDVGLAFPDLYIGKDPENNYVYVNADPELSPVSDSEISAFNLVGGVPWKFMLSNVKNCLNFYKDRQIWTLRGKYINSTFHYFDISPTLKNFFPAAAQSLEIMSLVIPFYDSPLEDWFLTVNAKDLFIVDGSFTVEQVQERDPHLLRKSILPKIRITEEQITSPATAGRLKIELLDKNDDLIERNQTIALSSSAGYLPKREITLSGGVGYATINPLGLEPGDEIKIDAGIGAHADVDSILIKVW